MKNNQEVSVINELRKRVLIVCGFPVVTKKDCRLLSNLIAQKVGSRVSETTIYRLFVSTEESHRFYASTLGVLASFVDFESWREFEWSTLKNGDTLAPKVHHDSVDVDESIWDIIFKNRAWNLVNEFLCTMGETPREEALHTLGWIIYNSLKRNPAIELDFYRNFCTNTKVRKAFFEFAAYPDMDLWHYDNGIEMYISGISQISEDIQLRDHLFAHSLMVRRDFVKKNISAVIARFEKHLLQFEIDAVARKIHPVYPVARLIEANWLYCFCNEDPAGIEKVKKEALLWIDLVWKDLSLSEQKAAVFCILEAVRLTNDKSEFFTRFCNQLAPFIESICGMSKDLKIERILERMEFNGLKLQIRLRENNWHFG